MGGSCYESVVIAKIPSSAEEVPIFYCGSGISYYHLQWNVRFGVFFYMLLIKG